MILTNSSETHSFGIESLKLLSGFLSFDMLDMADWYFALIDFDFATFL